MAKNCRDTALRYLEHRERSAHEVKLHLRSKGFGENEIEEELKHLEELGYVDDFRYCRSYISYGRNKGRGPVRIQYELAERGIDSGLIRESLAECFKRSEEKAAALREAAKLLGQRAEGSACVTESGAASIGDLQLPDEKTIAKIGRSLAALGYHTEVIYDIIGQLKK